MEKKTGTVDRISQKDKTFGIYIDDEWYNGFGKAPTKKGDKVEIEWKKSGDFRNITKVTVTEASIAEPGRPNYTEIGGNKNRILECVITVYKGVIEGKIKEEDVMTKAAALHEICEEIYNASYGLAEAIQGEK